MELKIMTFNVLHCEGMDKKLDIARTAARIASEKPDFACLQEIAYENGWVSAEKLRELAQPMIKNQYGQYLLHLTDRKDYHS